VQSIAEMASDGPGNLNPLIGMKEMRDKFQNGPQRCFITPCVDALDVVSTVMDARLC
jgi:hypothetical protein